MDISSYVLLSHEQALRRRLDVAANNMANMSTTGFKRERPVFREYVEHGDDASGDTSSDAARNTSFVLDFGVVHDTAEGAFQATDNPLDVMIDGPGYMSVQAPDGDTAYTRSGGLKLLDSGELATSSGQRVLDESGQPITVPADQAQGLSIGSDGTVNGKDGPLGRIAVTMFDNESAVSPRGDGMFTGVGGRVLSQAETRLHSGGIEASNVQPIVETTAMVDILRAYQTSMQMANSLDDMRKNAIDRLGRAG